MALSEEQKQERFAAAHRVTVLGVAVDFLLSIGKILAGLLGRSAAMVADGVHSLSDLIVDAAVLIGMHYAKKDADDAHPYGHGRYETLASQFIAVSLLLLAMGIFWDAAYRLGSPALQPPGMVALIAAILSIAAKEALYHYTLRVGKKYDARAIIANAQHHRSDVVSTLAALLGVGGAMLGYPILDPIAAIVVAMILAKTGWDLLKEAMDELTDSTRAIDDQIQHHITSLVEAIPEVHSAHFLSARRMGPDIRVDVHVVVDPFLSVSEGHQISEKVRISLLENVAAITEVLVHVDTVDDQVESLPTLSDRTDLTKHVEEEIQNGDHFSRLESLTPHYTMEGIILDLVLVTTQNSQDPTHLHLAGQKLCRRLLEKLGYVVEVRIHTALASQKRSAQK
ncbi:MAG: cation transporter [Magnetococcales bacterium]|nr:cation transporter [Magnetococcales bacterium]